MGAYEGNPELRKQVRKSIRWIMAIGLLIFAIGIILSVFVFGQGTHYYPDPRPFPVIFIGLVTFIFGLFMYIWAKVIDRADKLDI